MSVVGDGGGVGIINAITTITGSEISDNSTTRNGGGAALLFNGGASLTNSCITGNERTLPSTSSSGIFANWGADATNNWWGAGNGPSGNGPGSGDAVLGTITFSPFQTASIPCGPQPPVCSPSGTQSFSTNSTCVTPTPSPTFTPSPTPTPAPCLSSTSDVIAIISNTEFRTQPHAYAQNVVFSLSSGNALPFTVNSLRTDRPWLWPLVTGTDPTTLPQGAMLEVSSLEVVASPGQIPWISSENWIQVLINTYEQGTPSTTYQFNGFLNMSHVELGCTLQGIGLPLPDSSLPIVSPVIFDIAPRSSIFDINVFNAKMGSLGLHDGANINNDGATLDIVPSNIELCIDTDPTLTNCDPVSGKIPVYAPVGGCAIWDATTNTIEINIDRVDESGVEPVCEVAGETGDRIVTITHLENGLSNVSTVVSPGDQIGELCLHNDRVTACGVINAPTNPTHLAIQVRLLGSPAPYRGLGNNMQDVETEVVGFLASPALYDLWASSPGSTPTPPADPFEGR